MIKVYTNVSGVTPSPPSSRFVSEAEDSLEWLYFSLRGDRCPPTPSALRSVKSGPRWCSVPPTLLFSFIFFAGKIAADGLRYAGSVNDLWVGVMVG